MSGQIVKKQTRCVDKLSYYTYRQRRQKEEKCQKANAVPLFGEERDIQAFSASPRPENDGQRRTDNDQCNAEKAFALKHFAENLCREDPVH